MGSMDPRSPKAQDHSKALKLFRGIVAAGSNLLPPDHTSQVLSDGDVDQLTRSNYLVWKYKGSCLVDLIFFLLLNTFTSAFLKQHEPFAK